MMIGRQKGSGIRCRTLSLIELIMVLTAVGLLLSMLLPSLRTAMENGRRIHCTNNLRMLGATFANYSDDNAGYVPKAYAGYFQSMSWNWVIQLYFNGLIQIDGKLGRLAGTNEVLHLSGYGGYFNSNTSPDMVCPSGDNAVYNSSNNNFPYSEYGRMLGARLYDLSVYPVSPGEIGYMNYSYAGNNNMGKKGNSLEDPSVFVNLFDIYTYSGGNPTATSYYYQTSSVIRGFYRHSATRRGNDGQQHFLFQDGHVEAYTIDDWYAGKLGNGPMWNQ